MIKVGDIIKCRSGYDDIYEEVISVNKKYIITKMGYSITIINKIHIVNDGNCISYDHNKLYSRSLRLILNKDDHNIFIYD